MPTAIESQAEFQALTDALKRRRGEEFEVHAHPAVVLDRATGPRVQVWGWWAANTAQRQVPCLLWCSERGWSATTVQPDEIDAPGYELAHWSHRANLLDLALATAHGPYKSLGMLELHAAADTTLPLGPSGSEIREAMLWGIVQQRMAHARVRDKVELGANAAGRVDDDLVRHALVPTVAKRTSARRTLSGHKDPAVDSLVRALAEVRLTGELATHE